MMKHKTSVAYLNLIHPILSALYWLFILLTTNRFFCIRVFLVIIRAGKYKTTKLDPDMNKISMNDGYYRMEMEFFLTNKKT